jgi:hypothetical protein
MTTVTTVTRQSCRATLEGVFERARRFPAVHEAILLDHGYRKRTAFTKSKGVQNSTDGG